MTVSLNLYLARDPQNRLEPRLLVARSLDQAVSMTTIGMKVSKASVFEAYRYGRLRIDLEYAGRKDQKETA